MPDRTNKSSEGPFDICMLGTHNSGKTTYLGALWSMVTDSLDGAPVTLRGHLPPHTAYLDAAAHALAGAVPVPRTKRDTGEDVELQLRIDDIEVDMRHLDVSGETLEEMLVNRRVPAPLLERIASADGLMLFTHPNVQLPFTLPDVSRLERAAGVGESGARGSTAEPENYPDDQEIRRRAPTAVQLVDQLQIAVDARGVSTSDPLPVVVVVSAWDLIDGDMSVGDPPAQSPSRWISQVLPLLHQYLEANRREVPFEIFGVSAQGGDYGDATVATRLAGLPCAEKVVVVDATSTHRDVAAPLRWLLSRARQ